MHMFSKVDYESWIQVYLNVGVKALYTCLCVEDHKLVKLILEEKNLFELCVVVERSHIQADIQEFSFVCQFISA